jgi:HTH-type transcriptional regulator, sugar sensing transcriptional regulator
LANILDNFYKYAILNSSRYFTTIIKNMDTKEILEQLGVADKKADVYLACLEEGGATAYLIAKKVGLKRPTVYDILNSLVKEGMIFKALKKTKVYYHPADPESLMRKLKEREEKLKTIMPFLQNLYNAPKVKPAIRYFEGKEGIKEMYEDELKSCKKGDEILSYMGQDPLEELPEYSKYFVEERVKKGVISRSICKKTASIMEYVKNNTSQLRVSRVLTAENFPIDNEIDIYKNKIAITSYGKEMFGMIIESEELFKAQKAIFDLAWLGAEQIAEK